MTTVKSTKRALITGIVSLLVCFSLLLGSTFAWFTDSATSANNIISTGTLAIDLQYWNGTEWKDIDGVSDILTNDLWEPGAADVVYLRVANAGNLALRYQLGVNITSETSGKNAAGETFNLSDYIMFGVANNIAVDANNAPEAFATREEAIAAIETEKAISSGYTASSHMLPGEELYLAMVVYMPTNVGNDANHNGTDKPEINLGINIVATQHTYEADSFDEFYDDLAAYPSGAYHVPAFEAEATANVGDTINLANTNGTFTAKATAGAAGKVTVTVTETTPSTSAISFANQQGLSIASYDIKVTGQEAGSEVEIGIYLGTNLAGVTICHEGVVMDTANYVYNPETGFVTFSTVDFSEFDVMFVNPNAMLYTYADLTAVKGTSGTYALGANFDADNIIFFGNGTVAYFELNGYTVNALNKDQFILGAQNGSVLIINGNGTVNAGKGFMSNKGDAKIIINGGTYNTTVTAKLNNKYHASVAQNNSSMVINGGTFTTNVDNATLFMATSNATIEINGGFFENTADKTPDLLEVGRNSGSVNRIIIKGGTFVNYDPLADEMTYTGEWPSNGYDAFGGPWIIIDPGYTVVSETQANGDVWYSVVPVN